MKTLNNVNVQKATVKLQRNCRGVLKIHLCPQCGSNFDRASQLDYHHRSIHLGERSHICQICEKGFFRKADLRTHLNIHLGTNFYICEVCGRKFSHVSNLIRHCRMHTGIKPYSCSICDKHFTQISSLARHKQMIHGIPKETAQQCCNPSLIKKHQSQSSNEVLKENKDQFAEIAERLGFIDVSMNKTTASNNPVYDTFNNHEQQFKDNKVPTSNSEKDNFTYFFLPRDRGPDADHVPNDENTLGTCYANACTVQETCKDTSISNIEVNFHLANEVSEPKFLHKQTEVIDEDKKCNKSFNENAADQMRAELSNSGILKFDESRYCSDANKVNHFDHGMRSQHFVNIADVTCTPAVAQNQNNLPHDDNPDGFGNSSNVVLNNEEPMLRLVQTETGEQFYEFVISNLVEKIQNAAKDTENKIDESSNSSGDSREKIVANSKEILEKNDHHHHHHHQIDQQQDLESFTDEFNYTQFDFHGEEKNFTILCDDESHENFQRNPKDNECGTQDRNGMQVYKSEFMELLENDLHVDFDKYVETNLEAFEKLSYENCNRFLELVEVADLGIESSECKESSMIRLIQNAGEQLLELFQDSQAVEQDSSQDFARSNDLDKDCSNILLDGNKTSDCPRTKPDLFAGYIEDNVTLEENVNSNKATDNVREHANGNDPADVTGTNNDENSVKVSEETKKSKVALKKFQCSECKKAFSTAYNYKQHIGIHFTDQQKFHCKTCGISFAWKSTLNKHIANVHSPDGPQKFICDICPKVYSTLSQVNEHVKRDHLKQRDHMCLHCGKCFFKKFDLKTHSRTHTNERPYACRVCGRSFHHQSHIIRHERTHSSERPFACDVCQKTFAQSNSLKAHRRKHRPKQIRVDFLDCQLDEDDPVALAAC
ncbi:uncharacterized protein LOC109858449 [Pseudomyrmex gracilis]|uniref:uncharacterized protein LOC109858449 n=1 Tax=Pseudomyrmex gracilis TaxID=219809 RepID=UPI000995977D|nr:uncharacterized protein LOC109858449 [Pseudomyrmex gracilis]XP_020291299.1 uncharacterized protein LOC109858449 [Pseudomyrmex gracilis]